jgi:hypothetical protein
MQPSRLMTPPPPLPKPNTPPPCLSPGDNDVTVLFKAVAGAKRWQPLARPRDGGGGAASVEDNYTVILGSHRNSCLKFEKNGETMELVGWGGLRRSDEAATWPVFSQRLGTLREADKTAPRTSDQPCPKL